MRLRQLSCLLLPLAFGLAAALPGRAQPILPDRFAFADTTLLRDTLGLKFDRLFLLADSLRILPDSLRALSVRYRFVPLRLVVLADSLGMPVDSVGPFLERERLNPLAQGEALFNSFSYSTTYNVQQTRSGWTNTSEYDFSSRALFLRNVVTIHMDRFRAGGRTTLRQTRNATTEGGWRVTPNNSIGGRVLLSRFDTDDPAAIRQVGETQDEFQFSLRTRQKPSPNVSSDLNLFTGLLELENLNQNKRGLTADLNGHLRHVSSEWFLHELTGRVTSNFARTSSPLTGVRQNTRDMLGNVRGTLNLFQDAPVGLNASYGYGATHVRTPDETGLIRDVRTATARADASLRTKLGVGGSLQLTGQYGLSDQVTALSGRATRHTNGLLADGRYDWRGTALQGRFQLDYSRSDLPRASQTGGYGEDATTRSLDGSLSRRLFARLSARANARIGLSRYRYRVIGDYGTPPVSRDLVQQSYRVDAAYDFSRDFNTGVSLDVSRSQLVNLPSASTAANNTQRSYRSEWRWTYRLLRGLTATQRNTLGATYAAYNFVPQNDRLFLDYGTTTTLNAVLSPRLSIDLTHLSQVQPSGNYTRHTDGLYYLRPADEARTYSLSSRVSYAPFAGLSLSLEPFYRASDRDGTVGGTSAPQRRNRSLNFQGSANLNLQVARRGQLSGNIGRTFFSDRTTTFASGVPAPSPRSELDYWNGTLAFSWRP